MIRKFDKTETYFDHNKYVLSPISCYVTEEQNGLFELECELVKTIQVDNGDIIKAPTPRGEQLFRVYRRTKTLKGKKIYATQIFYDLMSNFVINYAPSGVSCDVAIKGLLSNAETSHDFTGSSNITANNTASFVRANPVFAILGQDGLITKWGGCLIRNNFTIQIKDQGYDRGYDIRMGKNLIGIEDDSDESNVVTRLYPTVVLGNSDQVYALPEKYVDSPLINKYANPIIKEQRVDLTDEQKALSMDAIYTIMRNYCNDLYETYNVDKPVINYKIDFVELSKTEQYKNYAILEQLDLYDIVTCYVPDLDINVKAKVIKYKYDCIKDRYAFIELGDFKSVTSYSTDNIVKQIQSKFKAADTAIDHATNVITGNKGGYVIIRRYPNGKPYEILIMDTEDINTAQDVLRINNDGIGFSRNGYNGPYGTAMTIDGHIVADFMDTGTLTTILLISDNYQVDSNGKITQGAKFNLSTGVLEAIDCYLKGRIESSEGNIGGWIIGSDGLSSYNTLAAINLYNELNLAMKLKYNGLHLYNHYSGNNEYLGSIASVVNKTNNTNGVGLLQSAAAEYLMIGFINSTDPDAGTSIEVGMIFSRNTTDQNPEGFSFKKPAYIDNLNGGTPITTANKNSYTYPSNIDLSEYVTAYAYNFGMEVVGSRISSLEARVSALEG